MVALTYTKKKLIQLKSHVYGSFTTIAFTSRILKKGNKDTKTLKHRNKRNSIWMKIFYSNQRTLKHFLQNNFIYDDRIR